MSTYTPPALNAVDFALEAATPADVTPYTIALTSYTPPALNAVDFALVAYTQPTFPYVGWELLPGSGTIASAAFSFTPSAALTLTGASINASELALTQAAVLTMQGAAIHASKVDLQGTATLTFQGDAVISGIVVPADFQIAAAGVFEATGASLNASTFDLSALSDISFQGVAETGVIASAAFGIEAQGSLTFDGDAVPDDTVVTLGADQWRIRKDDYDEEAEIVALMQQIIPMAVAHRLQARI